MNPSFMLFTRDVSAMTRFYLALGFCHRLSGRGGDWAELEWNGFVLSLHGQAGELPPVGRLQIGFETSDLDLTLEDLSRAGLNPPAIVDEAFGRILHLTDPDGNVLYIVQNEPELYV